MKAAGIPVTTKAGKLDFHACRTAYVNLVIAAGADVKTAQELSRHSTPHLTMNIYGRAADYRLTKVAETVGEMIAQKPSPCETPVQNPENLYKSDISTQNGYIDKEGTPCIARGSSDEIWYRRVELKETLCQIWSCMIFASQIHKPDRICHIPVIPLMMGSQTSFMFGLIPA